MTCKLSTDPQGENTRGNDSNSAWRNNTVHPKICPLAATHCCHLSQNFPENIFFCTQTTHTTWYHCSSFLREGPSGQRMNVGRHNNAKISLLNGLVWTRQGRRERTGFSFSAARVVQLTDFCHWKPISLLLVRARAVKFSYDLSEISCLCTVKSN